MPHIEHWTCPACTLHQGRKVTLNSAPFPDQGEKKKSQGADHLDGRIHKNAMKNVGRNLHTHASMQEFFSYLEEKDRPDLNKHGAVKALKEYIEVKGGDPDWTLNHPNFVPPPPPEPYSRSTIKMVTRKIVSSSYAKKFYYAAHGICRERLLCCWDDPPSLTTRPSKCIRKNCPYRHSTNLIAEGPIFDFFTMIPCTFAGMAGGCRHHSKRLGSYDDWYVEPFELEDLMPPGFTMVESMPCEPGINDSAVVEQVPVFDDQSRRWCKREFKVADDSDVELGAAVRTATERFLDGFDSEGSAGDN